MVARWWFETAGHEVFAVSLLPGWRSPELIEVNVEVVKKEVSGRSPISAEISFYFLWDDGATLYSPSPGVETLTVRKKKVNLKAEGDGLVTPNGPPLFPNSGVEGMLRVDLDGKSINIPLGLR